MTQPCADTLDTFERAEMQYLFKRGLIGPLTGYLQTFAVLSGLVGSKDKPLKIEKVFPALADVLEDETPAERFRRRILEALPHA